MEHKTSISAAILLGSLAFSGASFASGASGEALSYTCAGCHGTNGVSTGPATPSIAGMSEIYIAETMAVYKAGERNSTIMTRIAKGYSEEDFEKMAKFFAAQKRVPADQTGGKLAKKGAKIHDKYCEKCHSEQGTVADDDSAFLSGQWTPYLKYSFADIMDGSHDTGKKMMKKVNQAHKKYGDEMFPALLDFYASHK